MRGLSDRAWTAVQSVLVAAVLATALCAQGGAQGGGQHEGIAVHGHWTIDVLNRDGALVSHHEFENALNGGDQILTEVLNGSTSGHWEIVLTGSGTSPCQGGTGGKYSNGCRIIESSVTSPGGTAEFKTLTVSPVATAGQYALNTLVLTGTATALVAGKIDGVYTSMGVCPAATTHAGCNIAGTAVPFTKASPAPVSVAAGQTIRVTVTISFS